MAKIVELIVAFDKRGAGTQEDPVRLVHQLWTKDGHQLAEHDPQYPSESWYRGGAE